MDAWLSQHPTREIDEPATKGLVEAKAAELRAEIGDTRSSLRSELAELRTEMRTGFAEMRQDMAQLRADIGADFAQAIDRLRTQLISVGGVLVAVFALLVGLS